MPAGRNSFSIKYAKNGNARAAVTEPSETILVTSTTSTTIPRHIKASCQLSASSAPNAVATPFPPLNFSNKGQTCPRNTASTQNDTCIGLRNIPARKTARNPLPISITRVITAAFAPRTLRAFVVPAFPLPAFLMSIPFALARIVDGEMLPSM